MSRLLQSRLQYRSFLAKSLGQAKSIRHFTASRRTMVEASEISASQGETIEALVSQTTSLVDSGRWKLSNDGKALERQFKFRTFKATWVSTTILPVCWYELLTCTQGLHERGSSRVQEAKTPPGMDKCVQQDAYPVDYT
jgi:hypothetical protein